MTATAFNILVAVISVAVSGAAFYGANQATRARARSDNRAVDAAAYARATDIYESTIGALRAEIARLTSDVQAARTEIAEVRAELTRMQTAHNRLAAKLAAYGDPGGQSPALATSPGRTPC